jgi:hypothetical protein
LISLEILANGGGKTEKLFTGNAARRFETARLSGVPWKPARQIASNET